MSSLDRTIRFGPAKPTVFIGSSSNGLRIARRLSELLAPTVCCQVWDGGVFGLGIGTLDSLVRATRQHDFAILVLTPDDLADKKGVKLFLPRDNVVFELGLFMGALGKERTFIVLKQPKEQNEQIALPTDLDGITKAEFSGKKLESVCEKLRQAMTNVTRGIDLTGQWHSAYQRHDPPFGNWI